ncbi:hypothetical protein Q8F57_043430 [Paraburkholderia terrae]|uniref:hypothetical protein n=1 Tax=Paraburkholderia terrae TaxID=311230 RepID=UPI00296B43F1|nr:hypothetical protein [Paraburkholderia terrae]MDW3656542.1 hypothetical protein [Paraburkholderia terrae]
MFRKIAKAIAMIQDAIFSRRAGREYAWLLPMLISFLIEGDPYVCCGTPASAAPTAGSARMMPFYRGRTAELRSCESFPVHAVSLENLARLQCRSARIFGIAIPNILP